MQRICTAAKKMLYFLRVEWQYHASISSAEKHSPTNDEADTNNGHTSAVICDLV
jgi:hypothetical protein